MLLSTLIATLLAPALARAAPGDSFHESLTLHPLPDGKLSVLLDVSRGSVDGGGKSVTVCPSSLLDDFSMVAVSVVLDPVSSDPWLLSRVGSTIPWT